MNKITFKAKFHSILDENVVGLTKEQKINYMKKWLREFEISNLNSSIISTDANYIDTTEKIGVMVRTTLDGLISKGLLTTEKIHILQDGRHCKNLFDINYPMFKQVAYNLDLQEQRRVNGYYRYWAKHVTINGVKYLVCNDWYERNKSKFLAWANSL